MLISSTKCTISMSQLSLVSIYFPSKYYPFFVPIVMDFLFKNKFTFSLPYIDYLGTEFYNNLFILLFKSFIVVQHFPSFICVQYSVPSESSSN